jgi:LPXTG-motif cell wall-anchored protein
MTNRLKTATVAVLAAGVLGIAAPALALTNGGDGHPPKPPCNCGPDHPGLPKPPKPPKPPVGEEPPPPAEEEPPPPPPVEPPAEEEPPPPPPPVEPPVQPPVPPVVEPPAPPQEPPVFTPDEPLLPITGPQTGAMFAAGGVMVAVGGFALWRGRRVEEH